MLTVDILKEQLPKSKRRNVTESIVETINNITNNDDDVFTVGYRENFLSYISVMRDGQYKISDYMNAVKYVSYKLMEYENIDAYKYTFPDRYNRLLETYSDYGTIEQIRNKRIASHVSMYNKNPLVNKILDQSVIPVSLLNADMFQKALNVNLDLALHARSELVRTTAANSLLTHLKPKEVVKMELDIGLKENDAIAELRKATQELAAMQKLSIQAGVSSPKEIAESIVIEADIEDIELIHDIA